MTAMIGLMKAPLKSDGDLVHTIEVKAVDEGLWAKEAKPLCLHRALCLITRHFFKLEILLDLSLMRELAT
jgi:hypothetical protein